MTEAEFKDDGTLYASVEGMAQTLSEKECVFLSRESDQAHVMTLDVLMALDFCRPFRTLTGHVEEIRGRIPSLKDQGGAVFQVLSQLVSRDLLRSADSALERLKSRSGSGCQATGQGLLQGRQSSQLIAAADSIDLDTWAGRQWWVIDGSADRASQEVAEKLKTIRDQQGRVVHVDRGWRRRLAGHLASELGLEEDRIAAGLDSSRAGLWNTGLLLSAGQASVALDERHRINPRKRASATQSWQISDRPRPLGLVREDGQFDHALESLAVDVTASQLELLGSGLGAHHESMRNVDLGGLTWAAVNDFAEGQVVMTYPGEWGDVNETTNAWIYQMPPTVLPQLLPTRDDYYQWLRRPLAARASEAFQVTKAATRWPGAFDATRLLPPAPIGVAESAVGFGSWMQFLHPAGLSVHLPWMLEYREGPTFQPESQVLAPGLGRFVGRYVLFRADDCAALDPTHRLGFLAAICDDLAAAPDQRLTRLLDEFVFEYRAGELARMQATVNQADDPPEHWRADAKSWMKHEVDQITAEGGPRARDFARSMERGEMIQQLRQTLKSQADWLALWPSLWDYAAEHADALRDL